MFNFRQSYMADRRYGMVNVDLYSAIITKVSNALNTLCSESKNCLNIFYNYTMTYYTILTKTENINTKNCSLI